ncbi:uncharacterized protein LOC122249679 isoform X2 [Penaeus japonicus]|uniref:uncharacterized protein LOC122249679 isoform X2 n=1 Tax=Penaeus japonicus TaxID=27405 RepID=UPI001C711985|nr:uncharacterized protein LOC122249679 isoform X2 [Penaeus japonicus]
MTPSDVSCCEGECEGVTTDCFPSFIPCVLVCSGQHGGPTCLLYSPVPAASAGTHSRNFRRGSNCARSVEQEQHRHNLQEMRVYGEATWQTIRMRILQCYSCLYW